MATSYQTANFAASADLTITLASLASSTAGVGRQSTLVDNSATGYSVIHVSAKITCGTNALAGTIQCYAIRGVNSLRTDNAGASDAAWTANSARLLGAVVVPTNTTNGTYTLTFTVHDPGPEWGVGVVHNLTAALQATAGNFQVSWIGSRGQSA